MRNKYLFSRQAKGDGYFTVSYTILTINPNTD